MYIMHKFTACKMNVLTRTEMWIKAYFILICADQTLQSKYNRLTNFVGHIIINYIIFSYY